MILLEEYGIETLAATCVQDAVEIMQHICPDLLISEIILPSEDGYSLMNRVKTFEAARGVHIPAIAVTVCARECDRTRAIAAGFCRHVSKPLDIDAFLGTVACVLEQAQKMA